MTTTHPQSRLVRLAPVIGLTLLAPLTTEFLMGSNSITAIGVLLFLSPLYGCSALLIREIVRRTGRGWPTIFAFGLAFGLFAEAIVFQTIWNPNWMDFRLLDYGFIPALGTAPPWIVFVTGLHAIWGVSGPIVITESLARSRRATPWLGRRGLIVTAVLFAFGGGLVAVSFIVKEGNFLTAPRLIASVVVIGALLALGWRLGRTAPQPRTEGNVPGAWSTGAFALAAGSLFMLVGDATDLSGRRVLFRLVTMPIPAWLSVIIYLALFTAVLTAVARWSHRCGWSQAHRLALAGGAMLAYAWHSFLWPPIGTPVSLAVDLAGDAVLTTGAIVLLTIAALRLRHEDAVTIGTGTQQAGRRV